MGTSYTPDTSVEARSPTTSSTACEQRLQRAALPASSAYDEQHCLRAARTTSSTACEQPLLPASIRYSHTAVTTRRGYLKGAQRMPGAAEATPWPQGIKTIILSISIG